MSKVIEGRRDEVARARVELEDSTFVALQEWQLGTALHNAIARLSWNNFFEAVAIRRRDKRLEVFLRKRADNDNTYPGEWHAPGAAFRPGENERDVANRLKQEFGIPIASFHYVGEYVDWKKGEARGSGISRIYLVELKGAPREDDRHGWYPVNKFPEVTVFHHRRRLGIIPKAVRAFKAEAAKSVAHPNK